MAKGIELPVNVLIIVAIGVIVLIGLVGLLGIGIGGVNPVLVQAEIMNDCAVLRDSFQCSSSSTSSVEVKEPKKFGGADDLQKLCNNYKGCDKYGAGDQGACCAVNVCGCPGTAPTLPATS